MENPIIFITPSPTIYTIPYAYPPSQLSIRDVMENQMSFNQNGKFEFKCTHCKFNKKSESGGDTVGCKKNMFISVVGCNTEGCTAYEKL